MFARLPLHMYVKKKRQTGNSESPQLRISPDKSNPSPSSILCQLPQNDPQNQLLVLSLAFSLPPHQPLLLSVECYLGFTGACKILQFEGLLSFSIEIFIEDAGDGFFLFFISPTLRAHVGKTSVEGMQGRRDFDWFFSSFLPFFIHRNFNYPNIFIPSHSPPPLPHVLSSTPTLTLLCPAKHSS